MSMLRSEAEKIAFDPIGTHSTVTLDCAEMVLSHEPASGRDHACYAQLAALKATMQRLGVRESRA